VTALVCTSVVLPLTSAIATDLQSTRSADDLFAALRDIEPDRPTRVGPSPPPPIGASTLEDSRELQGRGIVRFGDTLDSIAERYELSVDQLKRLNPDLYDNPPEVGRQLRIQLTQRPRVHNLLSLRPSGSGGVSWPDTPEFAPSHRSPYQPSPNQRWLWPARGVFTSGYGWRWGRMHKGIDIANSVGTPIVAAQDGRISFAGWSDGGYGYLVEITHEDGSLSRYAHQSRLLVQVGEEVRQGQQIGLMGSTGRSTGPHLHFEIHAPGYGAVNPLDRLASAS
ncbi:MAG: M23 family metallopeptidase, partial [Cyanobacteriota bacterium]|nr:M23 family metallopeptidase [Cyanobacteriota bacterium]